MQKKTSSILLAAIISITLTACGFMNNNPTVQKSESLQFVDSTETSEVNMDQSSTTENTEVTNQDETSEITTSQPDEDGWYLVWEEDFSDDKLNKKYWNAVDEGENYNGELQYYSPENVSIENGNLVLTATNEAYDKDHPYTSGKVTTEGKVSFQYGKLEIRAKYPTETGMFPAIWMLPVEQPKKGEAPLPEIDIFESVGNDPTTAYAVLHYRDDSNNQQRSFGSYTISNPDDFHTYTIEWTENSLSWFVDDVLVHSTTENVPNTPMYLIINLAVGGNWFPPPDQTTQFPAKFEIDYVKYYQK